MIRRLTQFRKTEVGGRLIDIIRRPVFFTLILIGISFSFTYIKLSGREGVYIEGLVYSLITVIWTVAAARMSDIIIENAFFRVSDVTGLSKDVIPLIKNVSKIVILLAGLMVMLSLWRINIAPVLAYAGIFGAAVALAAKDTIANFFGGISLFVDKPFKIGDFIVLDKGERGEVVAIGIRSTKVKTLDDTMIMIPNSIIINSKVINESAPAPYLRIRMPVSVAYGSNIELVERTLIEIAGGNENVIKDPPPKAVFSALGEYALNFEILCWIKEPSSRFTVTDGINRGIYRKFTELGINIPFPRRDIHIYREG